MAAAPQRSTMGTWGESISEASRHAYRLLALAVAASSLAATTPLQAAPKEEPLAKRGKRRDQARRAVPARSRANGNWEAEWRLVRTAASPPCRCWRCSTPACRPMIRSSRKVSNICVLSLQGYLCCQPANDGHDPGRRSDRQTARFARTSEWLLNTRVENGWSYGNQRSSASPDNSNTQYALLALHEAIQAGYLDGDANAVRCKRFRTSIYRTQRDGGWGYRSDGVSSQSDTDDDHGRLCGLYITGMDLARRASSSCDPMAAPLIAASTRTTNVAAGMPGSARASPPASTDHDRYLRASRRPLLLPLRHRTGRPAVGPALSRRPRLVSRRLRVSGQRPEGRRLLGAAAASAAPRPSSRRVSPCSFSPRAARRCC